MTAVPTIVPVSLHVVLPGQASDDAGPAIARTWRHDIHTQYHHKGRHGTDHSDLSHSTHCRNVTVAYMNNATLETLALFKGDTIICKGKKRKDTVLIVLTDENVEEGKIQMNKGRFLSLLIETAR